MSWNIERMARDFVVNTEPMPQDIKRDELTRLITAVKVRAELEMVEQLGASDEVITDKAVECTAALKALRFHNEIMCADSSEMEYWDER